METYYDAFINEYKDYIPHRTLRQILMAYSAYRNNDKESADQFMNHERHQELMGIRAEEELAKLNTKSEI